MNLSNLPQRPDYTRLLYSVLERILPKSHYLPMTLDNMNTLSFTPKLVMLLCINDQENVYFVSYSVHVVFLVYLV